MTTITRYGHPSEGKTQNNKTNNKGGVFQFHVFLFLSVRDSFKKQRCPIVAGWYKQRWWCQSLEVDPPPNGNPRNKINGKMITFFWLNGWSLFLSDSNSFNKQRFLIVVRVISNDVVANHSKWTPLQRKTKKQKEWKNIFQPNGWFLFLSVSISFKKQRFLIVVRVLSNDVDATH